ncbi:MAG TPA: aminotransferase class III-fold pyridoxal phosphate-dependent enzyme, partial [Terriglobales bacterium]|nr:aminotransferase class III-fold pyridoxal phosphate-dependent enzyme [Terriglobales bacterium]
VANGSGAFLHGFTYNSHPVSVAGGHAVFAYMRRRNLIQAAHSTRIGSAGHTLARDLGTLCDLNSVGDVRGIGLLWGVEFVSDKKTKQPFPAEMNFAASVASAAAERGLLVYPMQGCVDGICGDHLLIAPPAVITPEEIAWAVQQLREAVQEVSA